MTWASVRDQRLKHADVEVNGHMAMGALNPTRAWQPIGPQMTTGASPRISVML